jgi:anti-sigma factor RsiW
MKKTISPRDLEMLSEYLDGRLDTPKRASLEARLKTNAELAETLRELSQTRALLRGLPKLKAPRSFKLTPEMAGRRAAPRVYPVFQFASVMASLLLVLVLAGDFLGIGARSATPALAPLMAAQAPAPAQEQTVESFQVQSDAQQKNLGPTQAPQPEQTQSVSPAGAAAAQPTEASPQIASLAAQETPALTQTESAENTRSLFGPQEATAVAQATQEAGIQEQPSQNETAPEPLLANPTPPEGTTGLFVSRPALRIGEIALAMVAVGSGLAAVFLKRRLS